MIARLILSIALVFAAPLRACELALVLAVDVSGSVDAREYRVQMEGLADALRDRAIADALAAGPSRLSLIVWSGTHQKRVAIDWTDIATAVDASAFADRVAETERRWHIHKTGIGDALLLGATQMETARDCRRRVIDVSGDGPSNSGIVPSAVRPVLSREGITVNAMVIEEGREDLTAYFRANVIHGADAFAMTAAHFDDYPRAIRRKLLRELTEPSARAPHPRRRIVMDDTAPEIRHEQAQPREKEPIWPM